MLIFSFRIGCLAPSQEGGYRASFRYRELDTNTLQYPEIRNTRRFLNAVKKKKKKISFTSEFVAHKL